MYDTQFFSSQYTIISLFSSTMNKFKKSIFAEETLQSKSSPTSNEDNTTMAQVMTLEYHHNGIIHMIKQNDQ